MCLRFKYLLLVFCIIIPNSLDAFANSSFVESRSFCSSDLELPCDYDKLKTLLSMDVEELIIDEDFNITTFKGKLDTNIPRIVGRDVTFNIHTNITTKLNNQVIPEVFIDAFAPVEYLGGMTFNVNGKACRSLIQLRKTANESLLEQITIDNVDIRGYALVQQTYIIGLYVSLTDNSNVIIKNISANNLSSTANNKIGDSCGNISALFVTGKSGIKANLEIYDSQFSNMHNYDKMNQIVLEDTNGIYVSLGSPVNTSTNVYIHDISGIDYGKRLIKTDCSNLLIENITASSKYYDTLSAISLNNGDGKIYENAVIRNVKFSGTAQYVVGSSIPETRISDIYSNITIAPKSYTAAILPSESCFVENLVLRGAQMISCVTNTDKKVVFKNIDYDDTMCDHNLYGSSLFLTKNATIELYNIEIKSDKLSFLFFDNYSNQTTYDLNVRATIDNLNLTLLKESKDWFLRMAGNNHIWDISIANSTFLFNSPIRGFLGISPSSSDSKLMKLSLENVDIVYNNLDPTRTIPWGNVIISDNTSISMKDVEVFNKSELAFSPNLYSLYVKNLSANNTYDKLYITGCNIDESKGGNGKHGISATGDNIVWSGKDKITHSNPGSINSLGRKHKKFSYRDAGGKTYVWKGRKWKQLK